MISADVLKQAFIMKTEISMYPKEEIPKCTVHSKLLSKSNKKRTFCICAVF